MDDLLFSIGEFSLASGLTIKTLRFYHEEGVLRPSHIDPQSGYRYYAVSQVESARAIAFLRGLGFPLAEIKSLIEDGHSDERIVELMQRRQAALRSRIADDRKALRLLEQFISERQVRTMSDEQFEVHEKMLDSLLIAGIRMKGRYRDCGKAFGQIGKAYGRYIRGTPFLLHYETEFKEDDADFEACMPLRQGRQLDGVSLRELPGARCASLLHKGPYDELGRSYAKLLKYVKERGYSIEMPTREVYIKGPGMIFKGNPKNYLTEIQFPLRSGSGGNS